MRPWLFGSLASLLFAFVAGSARAELSGLLINRQNEMLVKSNGQPARLHNNPAARDRTLAEVLAFVAHDHTNRQRYVDGHFMCTEYALELHDHAEAAGIRCGVASLAFSRGLGHALNVFRTADRGLVYIDCTGGASGDPADAYDTFGYISVGHPYGRLHVEVGEKYASDYRRYEDARAVFRNLPAWDKEMNAEQSSLEHAIHQFETANPPHSGQNPDAAHQVHDALEERVNRFNHMVAYRNALAKTFSREYVEDNAIVTRVDIFL